MTRIAFIVAFLTSGICSVGQLKKEVLVYGKVESVDSKFNPFSYAGIMVDERRPDSTHILSAAFVDSAGQFRCYFIPNTKVELSTFYENFYSVDTTFVVTHDSLYLRFVVHPKQYKYTEAQAKQDISNNMIQLITYDSVLYNWNHKINYTSAYGFKYLLIEEPEDYEFKGNIDRYNYAVWENLDSKDSLWHAKLYKVEDSLIHLEADNYWKTHELDLSKLAFKPEKVSHKMKEIIEKQKAEFIGIFEKDTEKYSQYTPSFILNKIDKSSDYHFILIAEYWILFHYETIITDLIKRITNKKKVGLKNSNDLIIWERIESGDLNSYGHGSIVDDDLFTIAGRANHLLREITGKDFGHVSMYSTDKDLRKLQKRWAYWILKG